MSGTATWLGRVRWAGPTTRWWSLRSPRGSSRFPHWARLEEPDAGSPGATYPEGFVAAGIVAGFKESGKPDMGVLAVAPEWRDKAASAAVFTTNAFAAAPVVVNRTETDLTHLLGVVMSSGNANACTGEPGLVVARAMQKACAEALGVPRGQRRSGPDRHHRRAAGPGEARGRRAQGGRRREGRRWPGLRPGHHDHRPVPQDVRAGSDPAGGHGAVGRMRQGRRHDLAGHGDHALRGDHRRGGVAGGHAGSARQGRRPLVQPGHRRRRDEHQRLGAVLEQRGLRGACRAPRGCAASAPPSTRCSCASP